MCVAAAPRGGQTKGAPERAALCDYDRCCRSCFAEVALEPGATKAESKTIAGEQLASDDDFTSEDSEYAGADGTFTRGVPEDLGLR